jgi:hypothetical protein
VTRLHVDHDQEAEVRLHCATLRSRPKAELNWFINDIPAEQLREFGVSVDALLPTTATRMRRPLLDTIATFQSTQSTVYPTSTSNDLELFNSSSFLRLDARKLASKLAKLRHTLHYQPEVSNALQDGPTEPNPLDGYSEQFKQNLLFGAQEMDQLRITCKATVRHLIEQSSVLRIIESGPLDAPRFMTGQFAFSKHFLIN